MSSMDHFPAAERCIVQFMKTTELTSKQILSVPCTTCGAAIGEACELHTGQLRTEPHRDRKFIAADAVETTMMGDNQNSRVTPTIEEQRREATVPG